ncbi:MAG: type II toxin-antitoxin system RelE/ParE family toxin [Nitrospinae bacterium]|nr:type II toxin-antitoxin system RelE/ParE family toxin [Nitrospinota bacterium]
MKQAEYTARLLQAAEEDLNEAIAYIALDNPAAAKALADKIENSLSNLSSYPFIGKIPNEEGLAGMGYRFLVVQNYLIFYTIERRVILVHRIIHGARDYLSLL